MGRYHIDLREGDSDAGTWIDLAQDRYKWRVCIREIMNICYPKSQLVSVLKFFTIRSWQQ